MSGNTTMDQESLFSLEVVVDALKLDSKIKCLFPAVAFRLLDFPTLLVYHVEPDLGDRIRTKIKADPLYKAPNQLSELQDKYGSFVVKKGKSCLFKVSANTLLTHLQTMPLYVMIVDTYPDVPKLVASCTVALDTCMSEVCNDIYSLGLSVPSVHGIKEEFPVCNLMGKEIGRIVLGVRLLSLGLGLLQHIPERSITRIQKKAEILVKKETKDVNKEEQPEKIVLYDLETLDKPVQVCIDPEPTPVEDFQGQTEQNIFSNTGTQTLKNKKKTYHQRDLASPTVNDEIDDFVITQTERPPPLFFNSEVEKPTSQSLLLSYYPVGIPAKQAYCTDSDSDNETIRSEDRFSDSDLEVDSTKLIKPAEKKFNPKTINEPKVKPPPQLQGSIAQLPILNALIQEISMLTGNQLVKHEADAKVSTILQRIPRSTSPASKMKHSESPRYGSPAHEKHDPSRLPQKVHTSRTSSPYHPPPRKTLPRTSSPTVIHRHICQPSKTESTAAKINTKRKGLAQRPNSAGVPKTKLQPGMTNTQRLRLAKTNPRLLETLEKAEQERIWQRRRQLQKKKGSQQFTNSTDLADVSTEIRHHPLKERAEIGIPRLDLASSVEDKYHKKPVPTPRLSVNTKESESGVDEDAPPVTPRPRKSKQHSYTENDTRTEQPDQTCHSEQQSSRIEVFVPSASVDDAHTDSDDTFIDDLELDSPRPGHKRMNRTKVLNKPGFPGEDVVELSKPSHQREEAEQQKYGLPKADNFDIDSVNKSGTMEGLSAGEELGLRCIVEKYSDDSSDESGASKQSSYVSAESHNAEELQNDQTRKVTIPENLKPASSVLSPDTFNESRASRQTAMATRQPFMAVSVSDMISNTQDSTAYINHSQVNSQVSIDSTSSYTRTEQQSVEKKYSKPSPRTPRLPRNISVRTDSLSSYVPSDQDGVQQLSPDEDTGDNYSDSFEEYSGDKSDIIVKPKSMNEIQVDPKARMGYTWGF